MSAAELHASHTGSTSRHDRPRNAFAAPTQGVNVDSSTRSSALDAWCTLGPGWRVGALATIGLAISAAAQPGVPLASGVAVALLVPAALVDVHVRRLPDRLVTAAALVFVALIGVSTDPTTAGRILGGALAMSAPLLVLHLISPTSMGFGDVKAAVVLGAAVGAVDWQLAVSALALAAGATAVVGILIRARTIAFGPGLVVGAALALAASPLLLPDGSSPAPPTAPADDADAPIAADPPRPDRERRDR